MIRQLAITLAVVLITASSLRAEQPATGASAEEPFHVELSFASRQLAPGAGVMLSVCAGNVSKALAAFSTPTTADVSLTLTGPDADRYALAWQSGDATARGSRMIWLKPGCTVEAQIGRIELKPRGDNAALPCGRYTVTASWRALGGNGQAGVKYTAHGAIDVVEYPLLLTLEPTSRVFYLGKPITFRLRMENCGTQPIMLQNALFPYQLNFQVYATSRYLMGGPAKPVAGTGHAIIPCIDPEAIRGWLTLLPGEAVYGDLDIADFADQPGIYDVSVVYHRSLLIQPEGDRPFYSKHHKWTSNEAEVVVLGEATTKMPSSTPHVTIGF